MSRTFRWGKPWLPVVWFSVSGAWLAPAAGNAQPSLPPSSPPPLRVGITLIAPTGPASGAVEDVTTELLAREHVHVSWTGQASFSPQDILAAETTGSSDAIAVWIDLTAASEARLYFRDSRADRFFLRSLSLPRGIDEMAKEEIAHIVASAVVALGRGLGETLTRTQARVALQMPPTPELRSTEAANPRAWRWSAALLLGGQLFARELPLVANASGLLAIAHPLPGHSRQALGGWASLGYQVAADYRGSLVGAEVQSTVLRAGAYLAADLSRWLVLELALGAGADRIRYSPRAIGAGVVAAPGNSFYVPAVSSWIALDFRLASGWSLRLHLSADVPLEQVYFDLHDSSGNALRVLEPYPVRPGVALGLAYTF